MKQFIVFVVISLIFVWCISTYSETRRVQTQTPSYKLSANQLDREYIENEISADIKYQGKVIVLSGIVRDIGKSFIGDLYVILGGSGFLDGLHCYFSKKEDGSLANLSKGQEITIIGVVEGKSIRVLVNGCRIQNNRTLKRQ